MIMADPTVPMRAALQEIHEEIILAHASGTPSRLFHVISEYNFLIEESVIIGPEWLDFSETANMMIWDYAIFDKSVSDGDPFGDRARGALASLAGRVARSQSCLNVAWIVPFPRPPR